MSHVDDLKDSKAKEQKDLLERLSNRLLVGSRILQRIGHRGFVRPNVAVSHRLYKKYNVQDPWDPQPFQEEDTVKLGPVSLRLGQAKRQPGRHNMPKDTRKKKPVAVQKEKRPEFNPKGIPKARPKKQTAPAPPPRPEAQHRPFGGATPKKLVGKLPVRPDLKSDAPVPDSAQNNLPKSKSSRMRRTRSTGQPTVRKIPTITSASTDSQNTQTSEPKDTKSSARRKMRRAQTKVRRPVVRNLVPEPTVATVVQPEPSPASETLEPEPPPQPSSSGNNVGLDDMFNVTTAKSERPRLRRKKK